MNSKAKGSRIERQAAAYLRSLGFAGARRSQQYAGSADSFDVVCDALPRVRIEVKGRDDLTIGSKLMNTFCIKAASDANGNPWAILWKRNRTCWHLTFDAGAPWVTATVCGDEDIRAALKWLNDEYDPRNVVPDEAPF